MGQSRRAQLLLEASKGGMSVGTNKDPLYEDSYIFGDYLPSSSDAAAKAVGFGILGLRV